MKLAKLLGVDLSSSNPLDTRIGRTQLEAKRQFSVEYDEYPTWIDSELSRPPNYFGAIIGTDENINWLLLHI